MSHGPQRVSKRMDSAEEILTREFKGLHFDELREDASRIEKENASHKIGYKKENVDASTTKETLDSNYSTQECNEFNGNEHRMREVEISEKIQDLQQQIGLLQRDETTTNANRSTGLINYKKGFKIQSDVEIFSESRSSRWTVMGLAILGSELFTVVQVRDPVFQVYDLETLQFKRRWTDERLVEVKDLRSCSLNRCLYLMNVKQHMSPSNAGSKATIEKNEIIRFHPNGNIIIYWLVDDNAVGYLSITSESNILLTAWVNEQLYEYTSEGHLVRKIPLTWNYGFQNPWHAIKLNSSCYVVCHGQDGDSFRRICIIDSEGKVLHYLGKLGSMQCLIRPIYMELDEDKRLIVIDSGLNRVIVLDSDLKEINSRLYHTRDGRLLEKVCVDPINRRVFVVERDQSGRNSFQDKITASTFESE